MSENTVPFEYTLRPLPNQPTYTPVVGEPWNPPPVATYLHLQVQLPFTVNRDYGLAVDWPNSAGMRPSANKVISLASDKTYSSGVLELAEDGALWAHYVPESNETTYSVELTGEPAEYIKVALVKLFNNDYTAEAVQLEDEDEEPEITQVLPLYGWHGGEDLGEGDDDDKLYDD